MPIGTEFMSYIPAPTISTSFNWAISGNIYTPRQTAFWNSEGKGGRFFELESRGQGGFFELEF